MAAVCLSQVVELRRWRSVRRRRSTVSRRSRRGRSGGGQRGESDRWRSGEQFGGQRGGVLRLPLIAPAHEDRRRAARGVAGASAVRAGGELAGAVLGAGAAGAGGVARAGGD